MLSLTISSADQRPLVEQIVLGICRQIDERQLRPGARLPSIRGFAEANNVSRFTVVEAYDRLVAMGYLRSRRGSGFYVTTPRNEPASDQNPGPRHNEDLVWLIRRLLEADEGTILLGGPWLPNAWLDDAGMRHSLHGLARKNGSHLLEYGNPFGYLPLREQLAVMMGEIGVTATTSQIVLTSGTSQALDLISRHLLTTGDSAVVDDPGYYNLFGSLRLSGVQLLGAPRNPDGPDIDRLEQLAAEHRPKVYFTQSVMQNPTGTDMSPHVSFRVLQLAERYGFYVVEDDIFSDLQIKTTPRLATLDQLNRVIYVRSFSKTLSGSIRVGFVACAQELANDLADVKMLTSITSSQVAERLIYAPLMDGHYRKYIARLQQRIGEARLNVVGLFERLGLELFVEPEDGMFLWARVPAVEDSMCAGRAFWRPWIHARTR